MAAVKEKLGKYPVYNPETDGDPFYWIINMAREIREKHINGQGQHLNDPRLDPLTGRNPHRPL